MLSGRIDKPEGLSPRVRRFTSFHGDANVAVGPAALVACRRVGAAEVVGAHPQHVGAGLGECDLGGRAAFEFHHARLLRLERDWSWAGMLVPVDIERVTRRTALFDLNLLIALAVVLQPDG